MKHINNYRLFKESSSREDLPYKEISRDEFVRSTADWNDFDENFEIDFINHHWIPFTRDELNKIQKVIPDAMYKRIVKTDVENARIWSDKYELAIIKLIDEWYYVMEHQRTRPSAYRSTANDHPNFYKCDQFDGLIKLLINFKNETY